MGRSLGNLKDTPVTAPPAASEPPLDENVTAAQLEERLKVLTARHFNLKERQSAVEMELGTLRTEDVLQGLDATASQRRDTLQEMATVIASDLREIARLKKLSHRWLQDARTREHAQEAKSLRDRELSIQQEARQALPGRIADLQRAGIAFCAVWSLANGERPEFASKPNLVGGQFHPGELRDAVLELIPELRKDFSS